MANIGGLANCVCKFVMFCMSVVPLPPSFLLLECLPHLHAAAVRFSLILELFWFSNFLKLDVSIAIANTVDAILFLSN